MRVPSPTQVRRELARRSLSDFIRLLWRQIDPSDYRHNWHIDLVCAHLEAVTRGELRRLLITIPPRHMKSIAVSVAWPAWTWLQVERSALRLKAKLLENAGNVGATPDQLEVLGKEFESGRTLARQDGYRTGRYARGLRSKDRTYLGIIAWHASNDCAEWTYDR